MKALIFDSGPLINLSMNGLLYILEELKKDFLGKFIITKDVKYETVDRPVGIQRFELGALRIQDLIDRGILETPESLGIDLDKLETKTLSLLDKANHLLESHGKWINIVSKAEISCLALSTLLSEKGIDNLIAVDERTTRILSEKPINLERIMSEKLHVRVSLSSSETHFFSSYKFIRSSEIVYAAYKKNIIKIKGKKVLEALLYASKYKGCAISFEEIHEILKSEK